MEYTPDQRELQDRFDTRRIADRIESLLIGDRIDAGAKEFIESRDMVFVSTVDPTGQPTCSYKGGDPGFVRVLDDTTLALPSYDGNGMFLSLGNMASSAKVGLLFIDFERPNRLRVHGTATFLDDDPLLDTWPGAQLVIRISVSEVFPNCPRYIHRHQLVERSEFVPRPNVATPVPDWKKSEWASDALPANDPARD